MKKTLVSALTTALVIGAASTTFAAANPFSDVPAGHWAYDAVTKLAADGVVEGYGDTTFQGDKNITRYEMAQMVAKAMAKGTATGSDKALLDRLAAEFSDELNNLGVRVSNLEKRSDMVKWNGKVQYTYTSDKMGDSTAPRVKNHDLLFRLEPTAEVNDHWAAKARIDAKVNLPNDEGYDEGRLHLARAWAQGDYDNFMVKAGKFNSYDNDNVFDLNFSGAEVSVGKDTKLVLGAGRVGRDKLDLEWAGDSLAKYTYAGIDHMKGNFTAGIAWHRLKQAHEADPAKDDVWVAKAGYGFDNGVALNGMYAKASLNDDGIVPDKQKKAYAVELSYKGAEKENKGTWGAWVAYRNLGFAAAPAPTYDVGAAGFKGWEVGADYAVFKNTVATLRYGDAKAIDNDDRKLKQVYGNIEFFF